MAFIHSLLLFYSRASKGNYETSMQVFHSYEKIMAKIPVNQYGGISRIY